ncbi:MAG: LPS assembly protein LptD [Desulfobulbus sp.]|nr:LPS assembly protein LptD [Desulfobulbus sp.]
MKYPSFFRPQPISLLFPVLLGLFATPVWAAISIDAKQWNITADRMVREENPPLLVAEGNVLLEKKEPVESEPQITGPTSRPEDRAVGESDQALKTVTTVKADRVAYDFTKGTLEATGNLQIAVGGDILTADSGLIDLEKTSGSFKDATFVRHENDLHFEGRLIEKTGELTYHIEDGWVVTCKLQPGEVPPWSFAAADTEITDGGYAFLKHATFRIKDVPVFYSPVMLLPVKHKRQTGLLFPSMSTSSRDGVSIETPLFINLSSNSDLTLYPRYFAERGIMLGAEYRYVIDDESKGMIVAHYLDDNLSDPSEVGYYNDSGFTHTNPDRYWIRGKADQDIGPWTTRLDLDIVSDLDYLSEFSSGSTSFSSNQPRFLDVFGRGFTDKSNRYRENTFGALRTWDNGTALLAELSAINDVSETVYTPDNPSQAWKLPSLTYSGLLPFGTASGPDFSWDANYTSFWREEGVEGQRFDLMPTITTGIPLSPYLESYVSGGVRNTSYLIDDNGASEWEDSDSKKRFLYNLNAEIGTTLARDFSVAFGEVTGLTHTLRPYVAYGYTEIPEEKVMPQFDWVDELEEQNTVYLGVNNFFSISGMHNGRGFDREYAYFKIKQGYDLRSIEEDTPLTPIETETGWYPVERMRIKYTSKFDVYGDGAFFHSIDSDYLSSRGDMFSLDYRYNELTDVNSVKGTVWYFLPYNLAAGYSLERNIEDSDTIEETIRFRYIQPCWSVELSSHSESGDQAFLITFRLANIGSPFGFDFSGQ